MTTLKAPSVFDFLDTVQFLKAFYKFQKRSRSGFSYELWANEMGLRSRSYLRAVVTGNKPLVDDLLLPFLKSLKFEREAEAYFELLFKYSMASTSSMKAIYMRDLVARYKEKLHAVDISDMTRFVASPLNPALFTYLNFDDGGVTDLDQAARDLQCTVDDIQVSLRSLIWNKLVDGKVTGDGRIAYKTIAPYFNIPSHSGHGALQTFHEEGISLSQAAAQLPKDLRKMYSTFLALDRVQFDLVQNLVQEFNSKLLQIAAASSGSEERIYRLNQQIFAISENVVRK